MNPRRLYRSNDRQLAGVAGGMAEYFSVDPTLVRILWILGGFFSGGLLIVAYIILAIVVPQSPFPATPNQGWAVPAGAGGSTAAPATSAPGATGALAAQAWSQDWAARAEAERQARERAGSRGPGAAAIVGVVLVVFGVIALADSVLPGWIDASFVLPALVIAIGAALLVGSLRRSEDRVAVATGSGREPSWASEAPRDSDAGPGLAARPVTSDEDTSTVNLGLPRQPGDHQQDAEGR